LSITQGPEIHTATDIKIAKVKTETYVRRGMEVSMTWGMTSGNGLQTANGSKMDHASFPSGGKTTTKPAGISLAQIQVEANKMEKLARIAESQKDWVQAEENLRVAVQLSDIARGANSPGAVRLLWYLEDILIRGGKVEDAAAIRRQAVHRMSIYLQDVPDLT
jgi:hypothetical protein